MTQPKPGMLEIMEMFAVPFGFARFPNCGALNDERWRLFPVRPAGRKKKPAEP